MTLVRDARAEARAKARALRGGDCDVLILEPAPPAVNEPPWFADAEPVAERIVSPFGPLELRWETLASEDPSLRAWCAERWLGPYARLEALPASFASTREDLHELAERVIAPARQLANTKIGLRWTLGGLGTPFFGADAQVRVEGEMLVVQRDGVARRARITTLAEARQLLGELAAPLDGEPDRPLAVDRDAARSLGEFYGFATSVLEQLRQGARELEPTRVQLWPGHFDLSLELGSEAGGKRAGYGASPGDGEHPLPYLYVTPWGATPSGEHWQAHGFSGAELGYADLLAADDQRALALDFYSRRLADLLG